MDKSDDNPKPLQDADHVAEAVREPTIAHLIDPPFQITVEGNLMHIDAPCIVTGDQPTAEVLRFSLSAAAAMVVKEALNMITFVEDPDAPGSHLQ